MGKLVVGVLIVWLAWTLIFGGSPSQPAHERQPLPASVDSGTISHPKAENAKVETSIRPLENQTPWKDEEWLQCKAAFIKLHAVDPLSEDQIFSYRSGQCDYGGRLEPRPQNGECYLYIRSTRWLTGAPHHVAPEIVYQCAGEHEPACSNALGRYNDTINERMRADPRCIEFPDLLQVKIQPKQKMSKEDVEAIEKYARTGRYEDLPSSIRFANQNKDPECIAIVDSMRKLENSPYWKSLPSVQSEWNAQARRAMQKNCKF